MEKPSLIFESPLTDAVSSVRFAPGSNNLLISSWDCKLRLYDIDCEVLRLEALFEDALLDCCFEDDRHAFSATSNGSIESCDLLRGTTCSIGYHDDVATCLQYSHQTCQVISAGLDKKLIFWDIRSARHLDLRQLAVSVHCMSLCDFNLIASFGAKVNVFDLRNFGHPIESHDLLKGSQINSVASSLRCNGYVVGSVDGRAAFETLDSSNSDNQGYAFRCRPKSKDSKKHPVSVNDIVFDPIVPGNFLTGDNEGYLILWNTNNRRRLFEFPRYSNTISSLSFNNSGNLLAVATSYTYQEANENVDVQPQIFVEKVDKWNSGSSSSAKS